MKVVRCTFVVYSVSIGFNEGCKVYIRIQMKMVRCPLKWFPVLHTENVARGQTKSLQNVGGAKVYMMY